MDTAATPLDALIVSFQRSLRAKNRADKTIRAYVEAARLFAAFQVAEGRTTDPTEVRRADVEAFITDQLERWSPSTAATRYRCLQQFWKWLAEEEEIAVSPMAKMSPPSIPDNPVPVFTEDELRRLLKATEGKGFDARRDHAIIRLFIDSGIRLGEMAGLTVDAVNFDAEAIEVTGKGSRRRYVPMNPKLIAVLDRYARDRARHPQRALGWWWLSPKGRLTDSGIAQVLERVASRAGIEGMHPHRFRHTFAHRWLAAGNAEGDLQRLAGWRSAQMLARYGASAADERARDAYRRSDLWETL